MSHINFYLCDENYEFYKDSFGDVNDDEYHEYHDQFYGYGDTSSSSNYNPNYVFEIPMINDGGYDSSDDDDEYGDSDYRDYVDLNWWKYSNGLIIKYYKKDNGKNFDKNIDKSYIKKIISDRKIISDFCKFHEVKGCSTRNFIKSRDKDYERACKVLKKQMGVNKRGIPAAERRRIKNLYHEKITEMYSQINQYFNNEFSLKKLLHDFGIGRDNVFYKYLF